MDLLKEHKITFKDEKLITTALTHTSYAYEHNTESYERLEYLGDAVLELVFSEYIFHNKDLMPGEMSRLRSLYVCENALYVYSESINLDEYILLGNGIPKANKTVIADVFESVFAVIFLENGINECKRLFNEIIVPHIMNNDDFLNDYKSLLQEQVQTEKKSVEYAVVKEEGPSHDKTFEVDVYIEGMIFGHGIGKSKKEAEQNAAKSALSKRAQ